MTLFSDNAEAVVEEWDELEDDSLPSISEFIGPDDPIGLGQLFDQASRPAIRHVAVPTTTPQAAWPAEAPQITSPSLGSRSHVTTEALYNEDTPQGPVTAPGYVPPSPLNHHRQQQQQPAPSIETHKSGPSFIREQLHPCYSSDPVSNSSTQWPPDGGGQGPPGRWTAKPAMHGNFALHIGETMQQYQYENQQPMEFQPGHASAMQNQQNLVSPSRHHNALNPYSPGLPAEFLGHMHLKTGPVGYLQSPSPESLPPQGSFQGGHSEPPATVVAHSPGTYSKQHGNSHRISPGGGEDSISIERCRAVIMQLERSNAELQKRVKGLQDDVQNAGQKQSEAEERARNYKEQLDQAEARVRQREQQLQDMQHNADAAVQELRTRNMELKREKEIAASGRDEVARLQGQCLDMSKELDLARKKIGHMGEDERRLQVEVMQIRKDNQEMQEFMNRARTDMAEMRQRLAHSEFEGDKKQQQAAQATAEGGGAITQMHALKGKVSDLEMRNSQLALDLASSREEAARLRTEMQGIRLKGSRAELPMQEYSQQHPHYDSVSSRQPVVQTQSSSFSPGPRKYEPAPRYGHELDPAAGVQGGKSESMKSLLYNATSASGPPPAYRQPYVNESKKPYDILTLNRLQLQSPGDKNQYKGGVSGSTVSEGLTGWPLSEDQPTSLADGAEGYFRGAGGPPDLMRGNEALGNLYHGYGAAPEIQGYSGGPYKGNIVDQNQHDYQRKSINERMQALQDAEDTIRARLAAHQKIQPTTGASVSLTYFSPDRQGVWDAFQPSIPTSSGQLGAQPPTVRELPANQRGQKASQSGPIIDLPYGTEISAKDMIARCKLLDDKLVIACWEKAQLETELSKLPYPGSGRNLKERRRKAEVEQRLDALNREISNMKMQLKKLGGVK